MKLLADENFPLASVRLLEENDFDVLSIGRDFSGITDSEIIELANHEKRIIVTFDDDFGELIFNKGLKPREGVIFFRWPDFAPDDPGKFIVQLFEENTIAVTGKLTVIGTDFIRQRNFK